MSQEQDRIFFRTFSLVLVILTVFCITVYFIASAIHGTQPEPEVAMIAKRERTEPVGEVNTSAEAAAEANAEAAEPADTAEPPAAEAAPAESTEQVATAGDAHPGKAVYDQICFTCHTAGIAGAPKFGDPAAWADRIAKGMDALYRNSLNGFTGEAGIMPPKGGLPTLSDDEVKAAVDYMVAAAEG